MEVSKNKANKQNTVTEVEYYRDISESAIKALFDIYRHEFLDEGYSDDEAYDEAGETICDVVNISYFQFDDFMDGDDDPYTDFIEGL